MPLSSDEKARLATELCGLRRKQSKSDMGVTSNHPNGIWDRYEGTGGFPILYHKFDPEYNWNHMRLVLEASVKKVERLGWFDVLRRLSFAALMRESVEKKDFNFGDAVCAAGLEVINQKGGE